jgi:sterol 3beta-glucosyltransferase
MRIVVPTTGSRGDVQPYVALGRGLQWCGHHVRIATHADFEGLVRRHGLDFFAIEANGRALQSSDTGDRMFNAGSNPFAFMREFTRLRKPLVRQLMEKSREACTDADVILLSPTALFVSLSIAEKLRLPTCWTALQPAAPTRHLANFFFPALARWIPGKSVYNLLTHFVTGETLWHMMRKVLNQARAEALDLPPMPFLGPIAETLRPDLHLYGFSPRVIPRPPDWSANHHISGYWFLDDPDYRPSAELVAFLESGPPPVYVGFGSMHDRDAAGLTDLVLKALDRAGQRGVLHTGWGALERVWRSDRVFPVESVPHEWLFPRMAAIIHHGGAGTTGAALRAGVPSLVVPFAADQPFWGRRTAELGAGPRPIARKRLTVERLTDALRAAVADADMRQRAGALGRQIQTEDGVARAVELFEQHIGVAQPMPVATVNLGLAGPKRPRGAFHSTVSCQARPIADK